MRPTRNLLLFVTHNAEGAREGDPRVTVALRLLENEPHLRLEEVAREVNLSGSRLRHLMRAELGVPVHRYLKRQRLIRARKLVESTFLTVKEIAATTGFEDVSHFLRDYKTAFGDSPSQARRGRRRIG